MGSGRVAPAKSSPANGIRRLLALITFTLVAAPITTGWRLECGYTNAFTALAVFAVPPRC